MYREKIEKIVREGNLRELRPLGNRQGNYVSFMGKTLLNMTSNDYLGIAGDTDFHRAFYRGLDSSDKMLDRYGLGAASSRLLTGDNHIAHELEASLKSAYGRPSCLLFNSGYHANIGIIPALTDKHDIIFSDKLNHASIHDGLRLSRGVHKRYRHCDYEHLTALLEKHRKSHGRAIIVTESVFSMDGDEADLRRLVEIKKRYDCLLYVDEAHGIGLYGRQGLGKAEEYDVLKDIDLLVGTFGKAFASIGAFVLCEKDVYEYLVNFSRSLIFTTALPPVVTYWNLIAFEKIKTMYERRKALSELSFRLRNELSHRNLKTAGSTNIIPVILGDNQLTLDMAAKMREEGFLIFAVRPPTVPAGTARFRLSLTATMQWSQVERLPSLIDEGLGDNAD